MVNKTRSIFSVFLAIRKYFELLKKLQKLLDEMFTESGKTNLNKIKIRKQEFVVLRKHI